MITITDDFWKYSIDIVVGDDIIRYIDQSSFGDDVTECLYEECWDDSVYGRSVITPDGNIFIWIQRSEDRGTIAHEAFHVTRHILNNVHGIPLIDETEEVYARMVGTIVEKINAELV